MSSKRHLTFSVGCAIYLPVKNRLVKEEHEMGKFSQAGQSRACQAKGAIKIKKKIWEV